MASSDRVQSVLAAVSELPPERRAAYLDAACAGDAALRSEVESLVRSLDEAGRFLVGPTIGMPHAAGASEAPTLDGIPGSGTGGTGEGPGSRIGPYRILQLIGEGGFGSVYMAQQEQPVQRKVALKIIKLGMDTRQVVARFEQERQALAVLDHPSIAKVFDAGATAAGRPYFVMELCTGEPIDAYCDRNSLSIHERLEVFAQVCSAVQHAHTKGIIHRDIKPSNVLVATHDGRPLAKVIDFGIAKATASRLTEKTLFTEHRQIIGTPEYMSPEQAEGSLDIDTRTDVYALGVMLYELLTGSTPFSSRELRSAAYAEIQRIIREVEPPTPSTRLNHNTETLASVAARRKTEPRKLGTLVRGELDWIVMKALEKDRQRRYESASGLMTDVRRYLEGEAVLAAPPSRAYRLRKFARRHRAGVTLGMAVSGALLVGAIAFAWQARVASRERDLAIEARAAEQRRAESEQAAKEQAQKRLAQVERANEILGSVFKSLDPAEIALAARPLQAVLVEQLDKAIASLEGDAVGDPEAVARIQMELGNSLHGLGEAKKAAAVLEKAKSTLVAARGEDDPEVLTCLNDLAVAYMDDGRQALAVPLLEQAVGLRRAKSGEMHPETLTCMNNLAQAFLGMGKIDNAVALLEETARLQKGVHGPEKEPTLNSEHNLALGYIEAGKFERATSVLEEVLRLRKVALGPAHPNTLSTMNALAQCYRKTDRMEEAMPLMEEALRVTRATLGADHPQTLAALTGLAACYRAAGQHDRVVPIAEEVLAVRRSRLGNDHPDTLESLNNLAASYQAVGKAELAIPLLEEIVQKQTAAPGVEHPSTQLSMNNLAATYWSLGRLDKSIPMLERVLSLRESSLGKSHPLTLDTMADLGVNYNDAGRAEDALPLLEQVRKAARKYPKLRYVDSVLLDVYARTGKREQFDRLAKEQLAGARSTLPPESVELAGRLATVGQCQVRAGVFADAEKLLRECLEIRQRSSPEAWTTFNTQSLLGAAMAGLGKPAEAEPLLVSGYQGMKQRESSIPRQARPRLAEAAERIVRLYEETGNPAAAQWRSTLEQERGGASSQAAPAGK